MARYEITAPDGKRYEVNAPDDASEADVVAFAQKQFAAPKRTTLAQSAMRSPLGGLVRGAKDVIDTGALLAAKGYDALAGTNEAERVRLANEQGRAAYDEAQAIPRFGESAGGIDLPRLAGNIAATGPLVRGAGAVAGLVLPRLGTAIATSGASAGAGGTGAREAAKTLALRAAGGGGAGYIAAGAVDPESAGLGAGIGAAIPVAGAAARAAGNAVGRTLQAVAEPFSDVGQQRIVGRALQRASGGDAAAIQNLQQAAAPFVGPSQGPVPRQFMGELVPGSIPTTSQAAGNPGIAALEQSLAATNPNLKNALAARVSEQNAARVNALAQLAGDDGRREFFDAARRSAADELYSKAYEKGIDLRRDAATGAFKSKAQQSGVKGEITKLMNTPAIQDAVKDAQRLMANEMERTGSPAGSVKGLDYLKRALDDKIESAAGNERRVLQNLKQRLLTTIDKLSPDYEAARRTFGEMSRPINQMDVAQAIADKSVNPLTGVLQPQAFARNLSDDTARRVTGFSGATLQNTFDPAQLNVLDSILADLQRSSSTLTAGRGIGSDTAQKLAYANMVDRLGIPSLLSESPKAQVIGNALSRAADAIYARQNRELYDLINRAMQDPTIAAEAMRLAAPTAAPASVNALAPYLPMAYRSAPILAAPR